MDWELVKPWVNRVGIVLEFLSFWLAAPEILGEERLRALERRVEKGIMKLPMILLLAVGLVLTVVIWRTTLQYLPDYWKFWEALAGNRTLRVVILIVGIEVTALGLATVFDWMLSVEKEPKPRFLRIVVLTMLTIFVVVMWLWTGWESAVAMVAALAVTDLVFASATVLTILDLELRKRVVLLFVLKLADDRRIRQRSLAVGAVLFVVGFLLQFIATF